MRTAVAEANRRGLTRLRGAAVVALVSVALLGGLGVPFTPPPAIGLGLVLASLALSAALARIGPSADGWVLAGDTLVLTGLLASTGGVANPFTLLYLYPVAVGSHLLSPRWSGALTALATCCFAALYVFSPEHHHMDMSVHLVGMVVAFALTAPALAVGVHRFRAATAAADAAEAAALQARASSERLASLAALAGGAAHELATPLGTILLVARELEGRVSGEDRDDASLIAQEVMRCRQVLEQLSVDAVGGVGQGWVTVSLAALIDDAVGPIEHLVEPPEASARLPDRLVAQALRRLVGNARAAGAERVVVRAACADGEVVIAVTDDGHGMSPEVLASACEPFFTTKPGGLGLGLFFVRSLAQQLGGSFELGAPAQGGTVATLRLPVEGTCASS